MGIIRAFCVAAAMWILAGFAFTETNVGHGKNHVFKVDIANGTLTDMSDYLESIEVPLDADEAEAAGSGAWKHFKVGQKGGDIVANFTLSTGAAEAYKLLAAIWGLEDLDFEYYPMDDTSTYPKISGKCVCLSIKPKSDTKSVPKFEVHFRPTGTITLGTAD